MSATFYVLLVLFFAGSMALARIRWQFLACSLTCCAVSILFILFPEIAPFSESILDARQKAIIFASITTLATLAFGRARRRRVDPNQ
jgi:hypothetical protein